MMSPFPAEPEQILPVYLHLPWRQARLALTCLQNKRAEQDVSDSDGHPVLPYLMHASVLFFLIRDLLAFELIRRQEAFQQSPLPQKLRQTPSYSQLTALLNSVAETQPLLAMIRPLSNDALPLEHLHVFRNAIIQQGIPLDTDHKGAGHEGAANEGQTGQAPHDPPFPLPVVDYQALSDQLIRGWSMLNDWLMAKQPFRTA